MATKILAELVTIRRALAARLKECVDAKLIARSQAWEKGEMLVLSLAIADAHREAKTALQKFDRRHPEVKAGMPTFL